MHEKRQGRAWWHWFAADDSAVEKKLILKLDLLIVPYAFIVYWLKYMDQSNINNAYVAGMKEELGFYGNELVHFQTIYIVGAVVGQLPFALLFPKLKMNWVVPGLDIGWGIFTLLQYRANSYAEIMAYRFFVGIFESAFFPAVHYVLGSWYRGDEIQRRGGVFYVGLTLGSLTAGLIQSGASAHLDGVHGLSGWRWMFIINAILTIPIGIFGVWIWPGTPDKPNITILTKQELELAKQRLIDAGHKQHSELTWVTIRRIFTDWKIYVLTIWDIFFWNASSYPYGGYLLWIKSLKRYSPAKINQLGSTAPAVGIFYVLFINFSADLLWGRTGAIFAAHIWNLTGLIILLVWDVPESAKWFAFNTYYAAVGMSSTLYGWSNDILKHDVDARAFTLIFMNSVAQSTTAWTPLLVFKTVEGPRFRKGHAFAAANAVALILFTPVVRYLHNRQERKWLEKQDSSISPSENGDAISPTKVDAVVGIKDGNSV